MPAFNRFDVCERYTVYAATWGILALASQLRQRHLWQEECLRPTELSDNGKAILGRLEVANQLERLLADNTIETCPCCGGMGAYWWAHCDEDTGLSLGIKHIGFHSGMGEWECPHCCRHLVERDSPLLAECYTHVPQGAWDNEEE